MAPRRIVAGSPLSELKRSLPIPLERLLVPHRSPNLAITGRRWRILILPTKLGPRSRSSEMRNLQKTAEIGDFSKYRKIVDFGGLGKNPEKHQKTPFLDPQKKGHNHVVAPAELSIV